MIQPRLFTLLLGFLLAGSPVVADGARNLETGDKTTADARRVSAIQLHASATDAASATTSNLNHAAGETAVVEATPRRLMVAATPSSPFAPVASLSSRGDGASPPLPPGVTELKVSEFVRQPIGPRGLEFSEKLRSLEGRRIRLPDAIVRPDKPVDHYLLPPLRRQQSVAGQERAGPDDGAVP